MRPDLETLLTALKKSLIEGLVKYSSEHNRIVSPKEIAVTLLAISFSAAKKTNMPYPKALAVIMVEACKFNRELAHAAIDDAFDDHQRRKKKAK